MTRKPENYHSNRGRLFVISGPSASGKTSLVQGVSRDMEFWFSISATTRAPRGREQNGVDYYFLSTLDFEQKIAQGAFLEYARVHDNLYGTLKETVLSKLDSGTDVILDIDVQGAQQVKDSFPQAVLIYVIPPSREHLKSRLHNRATDTLESIRTRLAAADSEIERSGIYKYLVVNDDLEVAIDDMRAILLAEKLRMPEGGIEEPWHQQEQKN